MRKQIIDAILAGQTLRQITAWADPAVSTAAIVRFKRSSLSASALALQSAKSAIAKYDTGQSPADLKTVSSAVTRAALVAAVDPFLARVAQLESDRARIKGKAEDAGDLRTWVSADRNDISALELHARLAGRLDTPAQQTNIMIVCPAGTSNGSADTSRNEADTDAVIIDIGEKR